MNSVDQLEQGLFIRQAVPADAVALARLAEDTFRDAFAADNHPDDMAVYCASAFAPEIQGTQIVDPAIATLVVTDPSGAFEGQKPCAFRHATGSYRAERRC